MASEQDQESHLLRRRHEHITFEQIKGAGMRPHAKRKLLSRRPLVLALSTIFILSVLLVAALRFAVHDNSGDSLPSFVTSQATDFTPYYFSRNALPHSLKLKQTGTSLSQGILVFTLLDSRDQAIGITQQKVPDELKNSILQGDESFATSHGTASISHINDGRMTGSLLTKEGTLILINTSAPIETDIFKDILRSFSPL